MNLKPSRKVGGGTVGGAIATLVIFGLNQAGITLPPEVASAITVLACFGTGWCLNDAPAPE